MDKLLQSLDQFKDLPVVKLFARFFSEQSLSPIIDRYRDRVLGNPGGFAKELLLWAVVLALVTFAVDQAFYWSKPGRVEQARESWYAFVEGAGRAFDQAKGFVARLASGAQGRGHGHGRR